MHIDWWTFALQAINVVVLVWLLKRFLFEPVQKALAARRAEEMRRLESLDRERAEVERRQAELDRRLGGLAEESEGIRAAAQGEAGRQADAIVERARAEAAALRVAADAAIAREREAAEEALLNRAADLAGDMAARLLDALPMAERWRVFLDGLSNQVAALDGGERDRLRDGEPIIASAMKLDPSAEAEITGRLASLLGKGFQPTFVMDDKLIAGLELRARHLVVANSWQGQLEALKREVTRS